MRMRMLWRDRMRNLRLEIEYDGSNYCGWQVQNRPTPQVPRRKSKSVQEVIERSLGKILQEKAKITASGRTDAGVHAKAQVANFRTNSKISLEKLQIALNGILPDDITIPKVEEAGKNFHSRFDARSKVYRYTILNRRYPSALIRGQSYFCSFPLNIKLMREESRALLGRHNFKCFQAADKKERDPVKTIKRLSIVKKGDMLFIDMEADGFLYNMARNIVGTLIEIGRGRFKRGYLKELLDSRNRRLAGPTAPPGALCLLKVNY